MSQLTKSKDHKILAYKTDLILSIIFILSLLCYGYYFYSIYIITNEDSFSIHLVQLIGDKLLIVSIIGYIYEKLLRRETEEKIKTDLTAVVNEFEGRLPSLLVNTLIYNRDAQRQFLSENITDRVLNWCLETKLKDEQMVSELRESFFQEIFGYQGRWINLVHHITLKDLTHTTLDYSQIKEPDKYLLLIDHISYKTKLTNPQFNFVCSKTREEHERYLKDETYQSCWQFRAAFIDNLDAPYFYVTRMIIDDIELNISRSMINDNALLVKCDHEILSSLQDKFVQVDYIISSLVRKNSNSFHIDIRNPTRELRVSIDASSSGIKRLSYIPYFITKRRPTPTYDDHINPNFIDLYLADWIFPVSGLTFVWQYASI